MADQRHDGATVKEPGKRRGGVLGLLRDAVIVLLVAFLLSFLIKTFIARSFYIPSGSMEDTLQVGDRIIVNQFKPKVFPLERGNVVVFKDPGGWLFPNNEPEPNDMQKALQFLGFIPDTSNEYLVKRVIGLPGDRVKCCDAHGKMSVNGKAIDEPYVKLPPGESRASGLAFDVTVPKNSLWVLGDNRYASKDSRYNQDQPGHGFVPLENVVGEAFVINWPLDRLRLLPGQGETFKAVPAAGADADETHSN